LRDETGMSFSRDPASRGDVGRFFRVRMEEVGADRMRGFSAAPDYLRAPDGRVRTGALLTMLDTIGGIRAGLSALPDGWVVSTNLSARTITTEHAGPLRIESVVLRRGRNNVVTNVDIYDEGARDALVMTGVLTSAVLVPENGPPEWERPVVLDFGEPLEDPPTIADWIGLRAIDAHTVEMTLADGLRNPWGILHGGVVASLVDAAAEHASGGRATTDVVLHFLAPNRIGPVRATARDLGRDRRRIEVRDVGSDRVTAIAVATST
jgi:uncharacterized protein (TIGR00369 family)